MRGRAPSTRQRRQIYVLKAALNAPVVATEAAEDDADDAEAPDDTEAPDDAEYPSLNTR